MKNNKKKNEISIRSSAAEYLTYVAAVGDDKDSIEVRYEDENIWLTQKMLSTVYGVELNTINYHIKKIYEDNELDENSTIRNFRIVQKEGNREVSRNVAHYNLQMIIAIGFKVDNERAVQFRKWANQIVKDYTIKGWVMDDERLKNGGSILTEKYFEEQLERIREIRMSERKFYQKITDIYATSIDYDKTAKSTIRFFTSVQNKLHYAVSGNTAAEIIYNRADHKKEHMGLTSWEGAPNRKIHKYDVVVAKNYLNQTEIGQLERMVSAYLDLAEMQAMRHIPMTMADWEERLNGFLKQSRYNNPNPPKPVLPDYFKFLPVKRSIFIKKEKYNKEQYMNLLLEADPEKEVIEKYLKDGELFVLKYKEEVACVAVITRVNETICELKNLTTVEKYRGKGYAKKMIKYLFDNYKQKYDKMIVGTSENNIPFLVKQGFDKYEKTIKNYFIDNYDEEIIDGDLQCIDMYYYSKDLKEK